LNFTIKSNLKKIAHVLLEDASDTIKNTNDTDKAIICLNLVLGQLQNVTNYNSFSSVQTALVFIDDTIQALKDHDTSNALLRLNLANQELGIGNNFKIMPLNTNIKNSTIAVQWQIQRIPPSNFLTYADPTFDYSIDYPHDWRILRFQSQPDTTAIWSKIVTVLIICCK